MSDVVNDFGKTTLFGGITSGGQITSAIVSVHLPTETSILEETTLPSPRAYASVFPDFNGDAWIVGGLSATGVPLREVLHYDDFPGSVTLEAWLPSARYGAKAVWLSEPFGASMYLIGGFDERHRPAREIIKFIPPSTFEILPANFTPLAFSAGVPSGTKALLFGGTGTLGGGASDRISTFDPDEPAVVSGSLPTRRDETTAAASGGKIYVFGGRNAGGMVDEIVRYDPQTDTSEIIDARLPSPNAGAAAAGDGSLAYLFGGYGSSDEIVRFDGATEFVTKMNATLPGPRYGATAVWINGSAYIFGGRSSAHYNEILRYNPASDTVVTLPTRLPEGRSDASAAWDGNFVYLFGGATFGGWVDDVLRYDPRTGSISRMSARHPSGPLWGSSAIWDGQYIYVFGGGGSSASDGVSRYDPRLDQFELMTERLEPARREASGIWTGESAILFGGRSDDGLLGDITRIQTHPAQVAPPAVVAGPGVGQISLVWQAPASGLAPITAYRIERQLDDGSLPYLIALGNSTTFVDTGLPNGIAVTYRVSAMSRSGLGPSSEPVVANTFAAPSAPPTLQLSRGPRADEITLAWVPPEDSGGSPIRDYRVLIGTGAHTTLAFAGETLQTTWVARSLLPSSYWCFGISARNVVGHGPMITACGFAPGIASPPQNLTSPPSTIPGEIALAWDPPLDRGGLDLAYRLYASEHPAGPYTRRVDVGAAGAWRDVGLREGEFRCYKVTALNELGESPPSRAACDRAPERPLAPAAASRPGDAPGSVRVEWTSRGDGGLPLLAFTVYRSTVPGGAEVASEFGPEVSSWTDEQRVPGARYYYRVTATNAVAEGPASITVSARAAILPGSLDADGDALPLLSEQLLCGSEAVRDLFESASFNPGGHLLGRCAHIDDYRGPLQTLGTVGDADEDWVPDSLEPLVCDAQFEGEELDGVCRAGDWGWPP